MVKITGKGNRPGLAFFGAITARDLDAICALPIATTQRICPTSGWLRRAL